MARRPNKRQRANARRVDDYDQATTLPPEIEQEPRVPLAGFESLYEITRSGQLFSVRAKRFIKRAHLEQAYIRVRVDGVQHNLSLKESVDKSWAQAKAQLYRVEIPATVVVVLARDANEAREFASRGIAEEISGLRIPVTLLPLTSAQDVPEQWVDSAPYAPDGLNDELTTVGELFTGIPPAPIARVPRVSLIAQLNRKTREK